MKKLSLNFAGIALVICFSTNVFAQTPGTLTFTFTPIAHSPCYSGSRNVLAVWIQTSTGTFIKTKIRYCCNGSTSDHLPTWSVNAGGTSGNCTNANKTDATTGATLSSFTTKTFTWDGKNVNGTANGTTVADGTYKVTIQETWDHGSSGTATKSYTFTKGTSADHQTPATDANFSNITLDWVPTSTTGVESVSENPEISVYPNPTNGIFNVSYAKASIIKVINILGVVVYEEKVEESTAATKSIDLTNFANGIYLINVSNANGGSKNSRIILKK